MDTSSQNEFRSVASLSLRGRVRSSVLGGPLEVEMLLLHVERHQIKWFEHLARMPAIALPGKVFLNSLKGILIPSDLRKTLGFPHEELENVAGEREVWNTLLSLPPTRPMPDKWKLLDGWK